MSTAADLDAVQMGYMHGEHCIILDGNDKVVGHDTKLNCHLLDHESFKNPHRAFSVFLFNSKSELLLQQRSHSKVTFPLVWTNTCCSHPLYKEDELQEEGSLGVRIAAQRKLDNELGISAAESPLEGFTVMGRIHYKAPCEGLLDGKGWGEHEIDYCVIMKGDVEVKPNPEEVEAVRYVSKEGLREILAEADAGKVKLSPWFRLIVDNLLFKWWDEMDAGKLEECIDMKNIVKFT